MELTHLVESARTTDYDALPTLIQWLTIQMDDARDFGFKDTYLDARHARQLAIARIMAALTWTREC